MRITRYRNIETAGYFNPAERADELWKEENDSRGYPAGISRGQAYREAIGEAFHKYTDIGAYPIIAVTDSGDCLCIDCAKKVFLDERTDVTTDIYYEGPVMHCDDCNGEIESAYGEPEGEE